jgi:hypothetical protein
MGQSRAKRSRAAVLRPVIFWPRKAAVHLDRE